MHMYTHTVTEIKNSSNQCKLCCLSNSRIFNGQSYMLTALKMLSEIWR